MNAGCAISRWLWAMRCVLHPWRKRPACEQRWRNVGIGPKFLKLCGRVAYRQVEIEAYEESCLQTSTSQSVAAHVSAG